VVREKPSPYGFNPQRFTPPARGKESHKLSSQALFRLSPATKQLGESLVDGCRNEQKWRSYR
jgi:hypothetical protein